MKPASQMTDAEVDEYLRQVDEAGVVLPSLEQLEAQMALDSLPDFIRLAWPLVEPETELLWNWHLDVICDQLQAVSRGELQRLILNVPPGTMKSLAVSVFWPAWEWAQNASLRYLTASYSDHNTIRDNRRLRAIVTSDWYQRCYGVGLASDQSAKVRFDTTAGGWRIASSVGGVGTGEHPDRILIDDCHKALEVSSKSNRDAVGSWFETTIATRKARDPAIIIVMQRLHEDDLAGRLLARGDWKHVCFPMRYEEAERDCPCHEDGPDPLDERSEVGELLWPDLWPEEKVREEELDLGPFGTAGQLQQRPAPIGGGFFKREWLKIVDAAPTEARRVRGWDTAGTEGSGDWTAGVRIAEADGIFYVEHVVRERTENADAVIVQTAGLDGAGCYVREEQEGGASGKAVITARAKTLAGYDYAGVTISGDKVTRARPYRAQCEAGNVKLVRGAWNEDYLDELAGFPGGMHDDQVDGSSCAFNALIAERPKATSATWGRRRKSTPGERAEQLRSTGRTVYGGKR